MASNQYPALLRCTRCHNELNLESKTLPCLHSFCYSCLNTIFEDRVNGDGHCPECHELFTLGQLSLTPFLARSLRRHKLSTDWKCDLCLEDGNDSIASNWCSDCRKLFCSHCYRCHNKLLQEHNMKDLVDMENAELIKTMCADTCTLHQKAKDCYCEQCNMCLCVVCYQKHLADSPGCPSQPLSVREEALKRKSKGPTLAKEMADLEVNLRRLIEKTTNYTTELNEDCDSKCMRLWMDLQEMMETAKRRTNQLCEEMRQITSEQVKRWRHLLEENKKILKQLEIWRLNLHHLLSESEHEDVDVVAGLRMLESKMSLCHQKLVEPEEKWQLMTTFPNWWLQVLEQLKTEHIGSVSLTIGRLSATNIENETEWKLCGQDLNIRSIYVSKEDNHIFLCDFNRGITEFTQEGEFVCECLLTDGTKSFYPSDMCSISPHIFVVAAADWLGGNKVMFLERSKMPPLLRIKRIIDKKKLFYSVCQIDGTIFASDGSLQVDSFTKEGELIKTIKTVKLVGNWPLIRANPLTGNFGVTKINYSEIYCYKPNGKKLKSMKTKEKIKDFCVDEFGHLYFCNHEGIFSAEKMLYRFERKSDYSPRIFVSKDKIFVCLRIDEEYFIKIFKILY